MVSFGASSGAPDPVAVGTLNAKGSLFLTRPGLAMHATELGEYHRRADAVIGAVTAGVIKLASIDVVLQAGRSAVELALRTLLPIMIATSRSSRFPDLRWCRSLGARLIVHSGKSSARSRKRRAPSLEEASACPRCFPKADRPQSARCGYAASFGIALSINRKNRMLRATASTFYWI